MHIPLDSAGSIQSSWAKLLVQTAFCGGVAPITFPFIQAHSPVVLIPAVLHGLPFAVQAADVEIIEGRIPVVKDIPGGLKLIVWVALVLTSVIAGFPQAP